MTLSNSSSGSVGKALKKWEEKLAYLLEQEAIASDAGQKFGLAHQIEEAREKIQELKGLQEPELSGTSPLHNLPYPTLHDLFTGRQDELEALEAADGTAAITQSAAISGLGGIGKTRLAVEYAWRSGNRHTATWFVRADSPENLRRNLAALASPELLNLPEWEEQVEDKTVAAVKRLLREHPGWLMILDNVDTPEAADAVLEALPSLSNGRVLITSRLTTWPATVRKQSLDKLSREEAVGFLLHRTQDGREPAADDAARAADLAERVDGLPLVLEQAAAYIIRHRMRLADYLRAWEQEREKLLLWYDPRVMQYPASVAVTWKQTFDRLSSTPATLLRLTAFLAPDPIPFEMLEQGVEHVQWAAELFCAETGRAADGKTIREATADLAEYSLITRQDGGMLVVHRLVQEALRSQIPGGHRRDWIEGILRIADEATAGDPSNAHTSLAWDPLRPHLAEIVAHADEAGIVESTCRLMWKLAQYFYSRVLYARALPLLQRALAMAEASYGSAHVKTADICNGLGLVLANTGRPRESESFLERALTIYEAIFGTNHSAVAKVSNNLGQVLHMLGRMGEAESLMRRALFIDEASSETRHLGFIARDLHSLSILLKGTNRTEEAELLSRRALTIVETDAEATAIEIVLYLKGLANLVTEKTEAELLLRRALVILTKNLPSDHLNLGRCLRDLAYVLQSMHQRREARDLLERAAAIYEKNLGPQDPQTRSVQNRLDSILFLLAPPRACEIY